MAWHLLHAWHSACSNSARQASYLKSRKDGQVQGDISYPTKTCRQKVQEQKDMCQGIPGFPCPQGLVSTKHQKQEAAPAGGRRMFLCVARSHCSPLYPQRDLSFFQHLTVVTSAVLNLTSSCQLIWRSTWKWNGWIMCHFHAQFFEEPPKCFPQQLLHFTFLPAAHRSQFLPIFATPATSCLFDSSHPKGWRWGVVVVTHMVLTYTCLVTVKVRCLFMCLLAVCVSCLLK